MTLRTCLLVSDDPDDHVEFAEALQEAAPDYVLMVVCDPVKAVQLLTQKFVPDLLIVDFALGHFDSAHFLETMQRNAALSHMAVVAYGNTMDLPTRSHPRLRAFLEDDISYSALRKVLAEVLNGAAHS